MVQIAQVNSLQFRRWSIWGNSKPRCWRWNLQECEFSSFIQVSQQEGREEIGARDSLREKDREQSKVAGSFGAANQSSSLTQSDCFKSIHLDALLDFGLEPEVMVENCQYEREPLQWSAPLWKWSIACHSCAPEAVKLRNSGDKTHVTAWARDRDSPKLSYNGSAQVNCVQLYRARWWLTAIVLSYCVVNLF